MKPAVSGPELRQKLNELYHLGQEHGSASSWCMPGLMDQKDKEAERLINEIMAGVKKNNKKNS